MWHVLAWRRWRSPPVHGGILTLSLTKKNRLMKVKEGAILHDLLNISDYKISTIKCHFVWWVLGIEFAEREHFALQQLNTWFNNEWLSTSANNNTANFLCEQYSEKVSQHRLLSSSFNLRPSDVDDSILLKIYRNILHTPLHQHMFIFYPYQTGCLSNMSYLEHWHMLFVVIVQD